MALKGVGLDFLRDGVFGIGRIDARTRKHLCHKARNRARRTALHINLRTRNFLVKRLALLPKALNVAIVRKQRARAQIMDAPQRSRLARFEHHGEPAALQKLSALIVGNDAFTTRDKRRPHIRAFDKGFVLEFTQRIFTKFAKQLRRRPAVLAFKEGVHIDTGHAHVARHAAGNRGFAHAHEAHQEDIFLQRTHKRHRAASLKRRI